MAEITDLLAKPGADDSYALATTVEATRTEGEVVLECVDVSTFPTDTPAFFITYQKSTDPVSGEVTIVNQTGWKGLVNGDLNTITNLQVAPGYEDIGNEIGDYVECIPTTWWGNSLIEALLVSLNPDGTLKPVSTVRTVDAGDVDIKFSVAETQPDPDPDGKIIIWFEPLA